MKNVVFLKKSNFMNTIEIQNSLIRKILNTQDIEILNYFHTILSADNQGTYKLNNFETQLINDSLADYENGNIISNDDVFTKTEKWLEE